VTVSTQKVIDNANDWCYLFIEEITTFARWALPDLCSTDPVD